MKNIQGSPWGKLLAALLLLLTAFGAGHYAVRGMLNLPSVAVENWQETNQFYELLQQRQSQISQLCELDMELVSGGLSFAQQDQKLRQFSQLKEQLRRENTWFRWQVLSSDSASILYSNLGTETLDQAVEEVHYATFTAGENLVTNSDVESQGS